MTFFSRELEDSPVRMHEFDCILFSTSSDKSSLLQLRLRNSVHFLFFDVSSNGGR